MLDRSLFARTSPYLAALTLAFASPAASHAQAKPARPMQYLGAGGTMLSANGNSNNGFYVTYGTALTHMYLTVAGNFFSNGSTTLDDDFQGYYLFTQVNDPGQRSRAGVGIGGGIWYPQVGNTSLIVSLGGFGSAAGSHLLGHFMFGYILPQQGASGVLAVRVGAAYTWR